MHSSVHSLHCMQCIVMMLALQTINIWFVHFVLETIVFNFLTVSGSSFPTLSTIWSSINFNSDYVYYNSTSPDIKRIETADWSLFRPVACAAGPRAFFSACVNFLGSFLHRKLNKAGCRSVIYNCSRVELRDIPCILSSERALEGEEFCPPALRICV